MKQKVLGLAVLLVAVSAYAATARINMGYEIKPDRITNCHAIDDGAVDMDVDPTQEQIQQGVDAVLVGEATYLTWTVSSIAENWCVSASKCAEFGETQVCNNLTQSLQVLGAATTIDRTRCRFQCQDIDVPIITLWTEIKCIP